MTLYVERAKDFGDLNLKGKDPSAMQDDVVVRVMAPHGDRVTFGKLVIRDCGLPLRHDSGDLYIDTLDLKRFTADAFNSVGNIEIRNLIVHYYNPDFVYGDHYHPDALGQFFNHLTGIVQNVKIHNIKAIIHGPKIQGFAFTEAHDYLNIQIGTGHVDIQIEYKYALFANSMRDSYINVGNNGLKIMARKPTNYITDNVRVRRYNGQLLKFDPGAVEFGKIKLLRELMKTKVALSAGHDRFRMHGAARYGITENAFWNEFLEDLMPMTKNIPGIEVKQFHRPNQKPIGYYKAMDRLHRQIDNWGANIDVDLHFNAGPPKATGHEVLHYTKSTGGRIVAGLMDKAFDRHLKNRDRNRKAVPIGGRGSYGLKVGRSKSIMTEAFFAKELPYFVHDGDYRQDLIDAYLMFLHEVSAIDKKQNRVTQKRNAELSQAEYLVAMSLIG